MTAAERAHAAIGEHIFDFYRCARCFRLITQPEMVRALEDGPQGSLCPCGGAKVSPTNLLWSERFLPRVWSFALTRARELGLAGMWRTAQAGPKPERVPEPGER